VNPIDVAAIVLLLVGAALGFRSGALPQLGGLVGAVGGAALVIVGLPFVIDVIEGLEPAVRPFVVLVALLVAVIVGESIGSTLGRRLTTSLGTGVLGAADRVAGAFVGVAQAVLIIWLVGGLLAVGPMPRLTEAAQTSKALRALGVVLPPPTDFALELGRVLDATGLPAVFVGFEPIPAAPVDRPDDPTTRALAKAALASVVKVSAAACGYTSSGTGFAVDDEYVVTNAHVVAGAVRRSIRVTNEAGKLFDAEAVLFDPELDVAVLHVEGLGARGLRFAAKDPARGALGASIGYPGGGGRVVIPAAVTGAYPAVGRDIYDESRVKRDILELRAEVDRGDSGGPLILKDGTVGGVVFAESRTDDQVGYALAPTPVAARVAPALGRTGRVDTGDCIR
jgi:S1-C subfamily serine protease